MPLTWAIIPEPSQANRVLRAMNQVSRQAHPDIHRHQSGQLRSVALAALVHAILIIFLWVGISWQNKESPVTEAEVWDMTTREAAPKPIPLPPPVVEEQVKEPTPVKEEVKQEDPEIAIAQEKKRKLQEKKQQEELQRELAEKKRKLEQEKLAEQKLKAEKLAQETADKKKLAAKEKEKSAKSYDEELKRMSKQLNTSDNGGIGNSDKSSGNNRGDPQWKSRIRALIESKMQGSFDNENPAITVEFEVNLLPDGSLRGAIRKTKSSGVERFDNAVQRAIESVAPFPKDKRGEVPKNFIYAHKLKE